MSRLQIVFASITVILSAGLVAIQWWSARHCYALRWVIMETKSLLEVAEEISGDISIKYCGQHVNDITKYRFVLHNSGRVPIDKSDIVAPLKWEGPGKVLSARATSYPSVDLNLKFENSEVEISWRLFNQKCMAFLEILCEGGSTGKTGRITGQIRNIPVIEEKKVSVYNENEEINRRRNRMQLNTPRFMHPFNRIFINKWILRCTQWVHIFLMVVAPLFISSEFV